MLRPGGLLIWAELDPILRDASVADHNAAVKSPNIGRAYQLIADAFIRKEAPMSVWEEVPLLLDPQNDIWQNEEGTDNRAGFTSMRKAVKMLPITPWHPSPRLRNVGILMQQVVRPTWCSFIPLFIDEGLSESEAEGLVLKLFMETTELGTKQLYINCHVLCAFKPAWRPEPARSKFINNVNTAVETW